VYTERFSLPFLTKVLIAAAERRRPGLGAWTNGTREELRKVFLTELTEVRARFIELFDDKAYWTRIEKALLEDVFPRYAAVAEKQTALEQSDYGLWRRGDLIARGAYAVMGLFVGLFIVKAPFIPIPTTWDALILGLMLLGPFVPDLQVWSKKRRFENDLGAIVEDMGDAQKQQQLYQPLPEISSGSISPVSEVQTPSEAAAPARVREGGGSGVH
jgi:hypothetical protein